MLRILLFGGRFGSKRGLTDSTIGRYRSSEVKYVELPDEIRKYTICLCSKSTGSTIETRSLTMADDDVFSIKIDAGDRRHGAIVPKLNGR